MGVCSEPIFNRLTEAAKPIFEAAGENIQIIIPPQPRYLFNGCCDNPAHCSNVNSKEHPTKLLSDTTKLRSLLKKGLKSSPIGQHWVMDTCACIPDPDRLCTEEKIAALRALSSKDGVHLSAKGYANMAENILATINRLQNGLIGKMSHPLCSAGPHVSGTRFLWRGFSSPVGSKHQSHLPNWMKAKRPPAYRPKGPYDPKSRKNFR